jgi:hypothetical protein
MPKLTRRESDQRKQAILRFFISNPCATGEEAQRALASGKLTGRAEQPMGIGLLFRIKRQAEVSDAGKRNGAAPPLSADATGEATAELRDLVAKAQTVLLQLPDVAEVRITRSGAKVIRSVTREEPL